MPRITRTTGTGITRRGVVVFDHDQPGDVPIQIDAAIAAFRRTSFQHLAKALAEHARHILRASGLIPGADEASGSGLSAAAAAAAEKGLGPNSPEGYALRILETLADASRYAKAGEHNEAMATAYQLGELVAEAAIKEVWERDALRGEKVIDSARQGHESVHGTAEQKAARQKAYVEAFERLRKDGKPIMEAYDLVARQFGVGVRTVERAVGASRTK